MKKLLLAGVMLAIAVAANAAPRLPELPTSLLPEFMVPSVRGGDHGRDGRRGYDDDRHDRGRHRGHYKKRNYRRDPVREAPAPLLPAPPLPHLPTPPMPPGLPRPPGF
jgi:hypothetical protein